jgi:hypothetical protein
VAGCECGDEPSGSCATKLVSTLRTLNVSPTGNIWQLCRKSNGKCNVVFGGRSAKGEPSFSTPDVSSHLTMELGRVMTQVVCGRPHTAESRGRTGSRLVAGIKEWSHCNSFIS